MTKSTCEFLEAQPQALCISAVRNLCYTSLKPLVILLASGYPSLSSYSNGELWNGAFIAMIALNGTSTHCHAYRKPPK